MPLRYILLLTCGIFITMAHADDQSVCEYFGDGINVVNYVDQTGKEVDLSGDFNGDGILDRLYVLLVEKHSRLSPGVELLRPLVKKQENRFYPMESVFAIGVTEGDFSRNCGKRIIIYEPSFFEKPVNNLKLADYFFLDVIRNNSPEFKEWKSFVSDKSFRNDAFHVSGKKGKFVFYWNGKNYKSFLFDPGDE